MGDMPGFAEFYEAVHGRPPFPWQNRLAARVRADGWPDRVGVPTGLGKTSTIDIAVWSLASQADRRPQERTVPTRVWYVVNRRLLVDAASDHVERLAVLLATGAPASRADAAALSAVSERLASLCTGGLCELELTTGEIITSPLYVSRLRGGAQAGRRPPHPGQPSVLCATVPMYGSRVLFRAYGSSNRMWPIDAALAGTDSLVLLDEAHLAEPLRNAVRVARECDAPQAGVLRVPFRRSQPADPDPLVPPERAGARLVALTATGTDDGELFDLDDEDRRHPVVQRRLAAAKPTTLASTDSKRLPELLASSLLTLLNTLDEPGAGVVFTNSPRTARAVCERVEGALVKSKVDAEVVVLTGQLRDPHADRIRGRLLDPTVGAPAGRAPARRDRYLIVIATQTLEVGADVDFDVLVTESAGVRALTQRFGRLNRLGDRSHAAAVICHASDGRPGGLYGTEPADLWARLERLPQPLDLSPASIAQVLGEASDVPEVLPEMLPAHLWELAKTSVPAVGAAPAELFFDGAPEPERTVSVCWRAELPNSDEPLAPAITAMEQVDVSLDEIRAVLNDAAQASQPWSARVMSLDGARTETAVADTIRPGQRLVLPSRAGGYGDHGWDPSERREVLDLSPLLTHQLHLTAAAIENVTGCPADEELKALMGALALGDDEAPDTEADAEIGAAVVAWIVARAPERAVELEFPEPAAGRLITERIGDGSRVLLRWPVSNRRSRDPRVDALDELSAASTGALVELYPHMQAVGELGAAIAESIGLPSALVQALRTAGELHDLGKADARFQLWLGGAAGALPLAKSGRSLSQWRLAQRRSGWPQGGRHELLSVQLLDAALESGVQVAEPDLVRHLVLAHHGHGRPLCGTAGDAAPLMTSALVAGETVRACTDPGRPDWNQPDRFRDLNERFGFWGLALLETILRQADHLVSAATEVE